MISHRQHLFTAAMIWTMVAIMLIVRGTIWIVSNAHMRHFLVVGAALVVVAGVLKGQFILSRTSSRMISHILHLDELSPFWRVYTVPMYFIVIAMIGLGILCRWIGAHWHVYWVIGYLYSAIGVALLTGSICFWRAWRTQQTA